MKSKYTSINFIIVVLFVLSVIFTTLQLFSLQDELIINVNSLSTDDIVDLSPVLRGLYITIGATLVLGLLSILLNTNAAKQTSTHQVVQTKSTSQEQRSDSKEEENNATSLDLSDIQEVIKKSPDKKEKHKAVLNTICNKIEAGQGAIYLVRDSLEKRKVELYTAYAFHIPESEVISFEFGEGLIGQVAVEGSTLNIDEIPENYINIVSGLGSASPKHLLVAPILKGKKVVGVIEVASFKPFEKEDLDYINQSVALLATSAPAKKKNATTAEKNSKAENKNE